MSVNMVDRARLQETVEHDLSNYLAGRMKHGPIPDLDIALFKVNVQNRDLNRKSNDLGVTPELTANAFQRFLDIQEELADLTIETPFLKGVRDLIHRWLPPVSLIEDEMWGLCDFGPGTVFHARTPSERSLLMKIGGDQTVTPAAYFLAIDVIGSHWPRLCRVFRKPKVVRGNRIAHVPKDVSKCRQIAVEPSLNVFLQKGIGEWLAQHLKRIGVANLETGQDKHRKLVRDFERWGTIDLSDASDRISRKVVELLLPPDWFELMDATRSHFFLHQGEWGRYESFSSQGNAFTFPLETMIFKAIAVVASNYHTVSVYGDDIIAPLRYCSLVAATLEEFGFKVNTEKSFWGQHSGELAFFRESCGADTLKGWDVRSVFFREPATHLSDVASLANRLYEKWGFLPRTHNYLYSIYGEGPVGPRRLWSSSFDHMSNTQYSEESAYLWEEVAVGCGAPPLDWEWCPQWQTMIRKQHFFSSRQLSLPNRYRDEDCYEYAVLAFLRSRLPYASPESVPKKRLKVLSQGCLAI